MDVLLLLKALVMGVVEGVTEFLPISSTGHLIVAGDLLNFWDKERRSVFEIAIQLGAILAICWIYRARIWQISSNLLAPSSIRFVRNVLIGFLPVSIVGVLTIDYIKGYLFNPLAVAIAFIVGGILMLWVEKRERVVTVATLDDITWQDALKIGLAQMLALFPGTSRSGATIIGGLYFGFSRVAAAEFSFFLALPVMIAATGFELIDNYSLLRAEDMPVFAVGFITAFISALVAVKLFLRWIEQKDFTIFAWYRIAFGLLLIALSTTGIIASDW